MADKRRFEQPGVDSNTVAELSKKLLEANAKLQEAELERKIMLENISHDLRAPLTAIRSAIDYIKAKGEGSAVSPEELADMIRLIDYIVAQVDANLAIHLRKVLSLLSTQPAHLRECLTWKESSHGSSRSPAIAVPAPFHHWAS